MTDSTRESAGKIDVAYVARLARINLTAAEIESFQKQLEHIVGYVRKIGELDISGVEATSHPGFAAEFGGASRTGPRDDVVRPGLSSEAALGNAPATSKGQFTAPKIVE